MQDRANMYWNEWKEYKDHLDIQLERALEEKVLLDKELKEKYPGPCITITPEFTLLSKKAVQLDTIIYNYPTMIDNKYNNTLHLLRNLMVLDYFGLNEDE